MSGREGGRERDGCTSRDQRSLVAQENGVSRHKAQNLLLYLVVPDTKLFQGRGERGMSVLVNLSIW